MHAYIYTYTIDIDMGTHSFDHGSASNQTA